jgi:diguanylate cyclase (GGDEF)-like protein
MKLRGRVLIAIVAATVIFCGGCLTAFLIATSMASNNARLSKESLSITAQEVSSSLKHSLQHEQDLSVASAAFVVEHPSASQRDLESWISTTNVLGRYPELFQLGLLSLVPAAQLASFEQTDLAVGAASTSKQTFSVLPAGTRSYYCLASAAVARPGLTNVPPGTDYCDSPGGAYILESRDLGMSGDLPIKVGGKTMLVTGTPVYAGGAVPTTVDSRRAAFLGWTETVVNPSTLLTEALGGRRDTQVKLRYNGYTLITFKVGHTEPAAQLLSTPLSDGFSVQVLQSVSGTSIFDDPSATAALVIGLLLSAVLAGLILVFGVGRSIALEMVDQRTEEIQHQALHDPLTGLPNRDLILDRLEQMLAHARRSGASVGVLYLDLDNFKDVNDTLGHDIGDELLRAFGSRMTSVLREGDTIGRMGGDEFIVLVDGSPGDGIQLAADRILSVLEAPFVLASSTTPLNVTVSIGIASGAHMSPHELLKNADIALYEAKGAGKRRAVVFSASMREAVHERHDLEVDLLAAVDTDQFYLLYQPVVELTSGAMQSVEALLRWNRPGHGLVGPDQFIPILELNGLIVPVERHVLGLACRQGAAWQAEGYDFSVAVNISARHLADSGIVDDVERALSESGFAAGSLTLELTETAVMSDFAVMSDRLGRLKALGVRLAIDDFGTGYSSLSYLRNLPVDVLKIDQSFIAGVAESSQSIAIVHTLVQLGKILEIETVAEGIETEAQLAQLRAEGVYGGQGFLFARPTTPEEVIAFLRRSMRAAEATITDR